MRHFDYILKNGEDELFFIKPEPFYAGSSKNHLAVALGATMYTPATRKTLAQDALSNAKRGLSSMVFCLEDSIPDNAVEEAEINLHLALVELSEPKYKDELPLLFVRIRDAEHLLKVATQNAGYLHVLSGFVFPKFEDMTGRASDFINAFNLINGSLEKKLYFMPIIESPQAVFMDTRVTLLTGVQKLLWENRDSCLAVRIGATDMSAPYGLRRSRDLTIWNVPLISQPMIDIINTFGRADGEGFIVTGAVWEHFTDRERLFRPELRSTPFFERKKEFANVRRQLIMEDLDGLIREVVLDRANGITGKTVIHPLHVTLVNVLSAVTHEEYCDAIAITGGEMSDGGAVASIYRNKMNEQKPHLNWAKKTLLRAKVFGVMAENKQFIDLLEASIVAHEFGE